MKWNFAPLMYNFAPSNRAEDKVGWSFSYQERAVVWAVLFMRSSVVEFKPLFKQNSIEVGYIVSITTLEHFIISNYTHYTSSTVMLFNTEAGAKKLRSKRNLYCTSKTYGPNIYSRNSNALNTSIS